MIESIKIGDETIKVVESMIFGGTFQCTTCDVPNYEAIMIDGTLYWDCDNGHQSKVVLYE
jgi:hypothetical protein